VKVENIKESITLEIEKKYNQTVHLSSSLINQASQIIKLPTIAAKLTPPASNSPLLLTLPSPPEVLPELPCVAFAIVVVDFDVDVGN